MIITDVFGSRPRMLQVPDNWKTVQPKLIYFAPGAGENIASGQDTSKISSLYANGSPQQLCKDGKLPGYAVLTLQGAGGLSVNVWEVMAAVKDAIKNYNINTSVVIMTGLSAGGQNTLDVIGNDSDGIFTAAIEMSCPGTSVTNWKNLKCKLLAFHGTLDGGITSYLNSVNTVNAIWSVLPGYSHLISVPNTGHSGWSINYDPANKFDMPGFATPVNIYDWAVEASTNKTKLFTASGTDYQPGSGGGTTQPSMAKPVPIGSAKYNAADKTITLNCSLSTGLGTFGWSFKKKPAAANMAYFVGGSGGDATKKDTIVAGAILGDWIFTLQVWNAAGTDTVDVPLTATDSGGTTPPVTDPPPAKKLVSSITIPGTPAVPAQPDRTVNVYLMPDNTYSNEIV